MRQIDLGDKPPRIRTRPVATPVPEAPAPQSPPTACPGLDDAIELLTDFLIDNTESGFEEISSIDAARGLLQDVQGSNGWYRDILRALVGEIENMNDPLESGYYGPFVESMDYDGGISVEWPNLIIMVNLAKHALGEGDADEPSD